MLFETQREQEFQTTIEEENEHQRQLEATIAAVDKTIQYANQKKIEYDSMIQEQDEKLAELESFFLSGP